MKFYLFLIMPLFAFIQTIQAQKSSFGVVAGPNVSSVMGDLTESNNPRLGYHFGVFAEVLLSNKLSFKPELSYSSIGYILDTDFRTRFPFSENPGDGEISFTSAERSNYLAVPLALRINFTQLFGLEVGPQASFLINSVSKLKKSEGFENQDDRNSYSGDFRLDYGAVLGIGFNLNDRFSLRLRYYHGLRDLFRGEIGDFANYNRALQLSLGYSFL